MIIRRHAKHLNPSGQNLLRYNKFHGTRGDLKDGRMPKQSMGGRVVLLVSSPSSFFPSFLQHQPSHASRGESKLQPSAVNIVFSNGPAEDESVTGLKTVTFSLTGTGTIDSILVEIAEVGDLIPHLPISLERRGCLISILHLKQTEPIRFDTDGIQMSAMLLLRQR